PALRPDDSEPRLDVRLAGPWVRRRLDRILRVRRVAEPHPLHPARVGLFVDQPRRIGRPDVAAEAIELLLRDELRLAVGDETLSAGGELLLALGIGNPQLVAADEGDRRAIGRQRR